MTNAVSFSDFRNNLSDYLSYLKAGNSIVIKDAKKGVDIVTLVAQKEPEFNWSEYMKLFKSIGGSGFLSSPENIKSMNKFRNSFNKRFEEAKNR